MSHKNPRLARSLDYLRRGRVAPRPETEVPGQADTRTDFTTPDCSELGKILANRWRLRLVYGLDAIEELAEIALCDLNSGSAVSAVCRPQLPPHPRLAQRTFWPFPGAAMANARLPSPAQFGFLTDDTLSYRQLAHPCARTRRSVHVPLFAFDVFELGPK